MFQRVLQGGKPPTHEVRVQSSSGEYRTGEFTITPHIQDGSIVGVLGIGRDATERKRLEMHLAQAQKLESIGQLAAGIAHEINTPTQYVGDNVRFLQDAFGDLNLLFGKCEQLLRAVKSGGDTGRLAQEVETAVEDVDLPYLREEIPKGIGQTLEGVERVSRIVRAMKEFSHPGTIEKTPLDINKAIETTITVARNEWKYVAEIVTNFDEKLPLVPCLPGDFNQVILNMITNAAHAIAEVVGDGSHRKGTIEVSTRRDEKRAQVCIRDTGSGIPEEVRSRIFDPFYTTKEVGEGTGQGLAISHSVIVKKLGGTLDFETEVGKGTTFVIGLPIESEPA
jgi:signal transduction histidine kinase